MSLVAAEGFKDLCGDLEEHIEDCGDQDGHRSVFNSLDTQDINGNTQEHKHDTPKDDATEDKISIQAADEAGKVFNSGQFSLDVNLSQFDRSSVSHVSLD